MSFIHQLDNLNQLRAAVMLYSPKDEHGDLTMPYRRWLTQIDKDILKAVKYLEAQGGNFESLGKILTELPSDLQESDLSPEDDGE